VHNAFYEPAGPGTFMATAATAGPWTEHAQHGGPPSALAARALEMHDRDDGQRLARVAIDILRAVPIAKVTITTRTARPGKRVTLIDAVMEAGGQEVLHARGWRLARAEAGEVPPVPPVTAAAQPPEARRHEEPPDLPGLAEPPGLHESPQTAAHPATLARARLPQIPAEHTSPVFPGGHAGGYLSAIEWRFLPGAGFHQLGPGRAWTRPRIPLVAGEESTPMSRALIVADSGSGVSASLDAAQYLFINVDLTMVMPRDPIGEWLLLDAVTTISETGTGVSETTLSDTRGPFGTALQTLLVAPR
jgi:hypothetical protein